MASTESEVMAVNLHALTSSTTMNLEMTAIGWWPMTGERSCEDAMLTLLGFQAVSDCEPLGEKTRTSPVRKKTTRALWRGRRRQLQADTSAVARYIVFVHCCY